MKLEIIFCKFFYINKFEVEGHIFVFNKIFEKNKDFYFVFVTILSYLSSYYGFLTHPSNWGYKDCIDIWHMKKTQKNDNSR